MRNNARNVIGIVRVTKSVKSGYNHVRGSVKNN